MKTITQTTIQGQVESVKPATENDYLVEFVIKTIREGETTWLNVTATGWEAWSLRTGDLLSLTGKLTSETWQDPFEHSEIEALEMSATSLERLTA